MNKKFEDGTKYCHFFYPEIKKFIDNDTIQRIEKELLNEDSNIFNLFDEKRHKGENDSYLCSLIRNDSIIDFISHVNHKNYPLNSYIKKSIFETNCYLIRKNITLIEYAAFFGSIQIFQYLKMNQIKLNSNLWFYSIHSNNPDLIYILEENDVDPENKTYSTCFVEAIRCHYNDIANYFLENKLEKIDSQTKDDITSNIFDSLNYFYFFEEHFDEDSIFYYLCKYHYNKIVNYFIEITEKEISYDNIFF